MKEECCGTCKFHYHDEKDGWICVNGDSINATYWTEYTDKCEEWEER